MPVTKFVAGWDLVSRGAPLQIELVDFISQRLKTVLNDDETMTNFLIISKQNTKLHDFND